MPVPTNRPGPGLPKRTNPGSGNLPNRPPVQQRRTDRNPPNESLPDLSEINPIGQSRNEGPTRRPTAPGRPSRPEGRRANPVEEYNGESQGDFRNEFDNDDDDTFKKLSIDEQLEYEEEEDQEARRKAAKRRSAERRAEEELSRRLAERQARLEKPSDEEEILFENDEYLPEELTISADNEDRGELLEDNEEEIKPLPSSKGREGKNQASRPKDMTEDNEKDEYGQDVFIDEKDLKLKPFGTKKGKKNRKTRTKENEYDSRKNMRTNATIARFVFLAIFVLVAGLGVKNTYFPAPALSEEEITGIVAETANLTNFPLDRGGAFAKDFAQAYLSTDQEQETLNQGILNYFYSGEISLESATVSTRSISTGYSQNVIYGPTIYESEALLDYSARFTIGAVVQTPVSEENVADSGAQWIFMNVNVYYNEGTDSFTITPDSPAILPELPIGLAADLPLEEPLGEENTDESMREKIQPVTYGFLNGYRVSTTEDHSTLDQYIMSNAPASLKTGLGGKYDFAGGTVESATTYQIFSDLTDPGLMKVKATVLWANGSEENGMQFASTYVLFLREQSNGMYLVERFQPFYFVADEQSLAESQAAEEAATEDEVVPENEEAVAPVDGE